MGPVSRPTSREASFAPTDSLLPPLSPLTPRLCAFYFLFYVPALTDEPRTFCVLHKKEEKKTQGGIREEEQREDEKEVTEVEDPWGHQEAV